MTRRSPPELISKRCTIKLLRLSFYRTFPTAAAVLGPGYRQFVNRSSLLFPGTHWVEGASWPWHAILSSQLTTQNSVNPRSWLGRCQALEAPNDLPDSSGNPKPWRCVSPG